MCVRTIVDASVASKFVHQKSGSVARLRKWIDRKDGLLVYWSVGKFGEEMRKTRRLLELLNRYRQKGSAHLVGPELAASSLERIDRAKMKSNDAHVLALALAGEALVLAACDGRLRHDFANRELLDSPTQGTRAAYPLKASAKVQRDFLAIRRCPRRKRAT